jgi:hypothetical protein
MSASPPRPEALASARRISLSGLSSASDQDAAPADDTATPEPDVANEAQEAQVSWMNND